MIFATPLNSLIDRAMRDPHSLIALEIPALANVSTQRCAALCRDGSMCRRRPAGPLTRSRNVPTAAARGEIRLDDLKPATSA